MLSLFLLLSPVDAFLSLLSLSIASDYFEFPDVREVPSTSVQNDPTRESVKVPISLSRVYRNL